MSLNPFLLLCLALPLCIHPWRSRFCRAAKRCKKFDPEVAVSQLNCDCSLSGTWQEIDRANLSSLLKLRREFTDNYNIVRDRVASGAFPNLDPASNMLVVTYDMGLEHLARCCRYQDCTVTTIKECVVGASHQKFVYNYYAEKKVVDAEKIVQSWVSSVQLANSTIDHYSYVFNEEDFLVAVIWATVDRIGCWRWKRGFKDNDVVTVCIHDTLSGQNMALTDEDPVYVKGEACSRCPDGTKCENGTYKYLCGKERPVPSEKPKFFELSSTNATRKTTADNGTSRAAEETSRSGGRADDLNLKIAMLFSVAIHFKFRF